MVHTPIKPNAASERQKVIDWLIAHNYPPLPVAPAQEARKYYKLVQVGSNKDVLSYCPLTIDLQPIPLYTGKNPSFLDKNGVPHLVNHRQYQNRLPSEREKEDWFTNSANGIGTLGGWNNTVWLDFDVKQFPSQQECDAAVQKILSLPELQQTFVERSHSGGWRIGVKVKQKPDFTNFSLTRGGSHVGEALFKGRFTVLAPTIGPSGNPYCSVNRTIPTEVNSLKTIGIYSTKNASGIGNSQSPVTNPQSSFPIPGSIPLEMLGNDTSRDILRGNYSTEDRSKTLTTATQEWYGWQNWAKENGIPIIGDAPTLAHYTGSLLGLDTDRINRILKTIDSGKCHPAALYRGGNQSCWRKIHRLDKAIFSANCPADIKEAITVEWGQGSGNGNGSGGGRPGGSGIGNGDGGDGFDGDNGANGSRVVKLPSTQPLDTSRIRTQIKETLIQDLPPSKLQSAKIRIRSDNPRVSERELSRLFETIEQELELEESRCDRRSEVDNLLKLGDQSVNISNFLPTDLAQPLKALAQNLNIRPEVCLTSLLVATSSLHKTKTELVIHRGQNFRVPPTIFAGLVSESGQKKSPILKAIIKNPLSVLQQEKRKDFQEAQARYEKDIASWDKCKSGERSSKFQDGKPKIPQQRLYYFTNATGEGLLYQFQAHPDKALLALVDELVGLFASQNKYSGGRGSDRQDILSAFDGTGATVLRAAGTKADIDGLLLSICGTIQPEVLKRLMRDCSDPDGQWARFLFVNQPLSAATLGNDNGSDFELSERLLNYYRAIDQLPTIEYRLSREAFKRYQPVYNQLEQLRVSHPNPGMRAVYSKMEGYIGRLALNLHVLFELADGKTIPDEKIPLSILEKAIALAKFYIGQIKLIHANCAADMGEMAPYLVKVVELSKRMETTTGVSWIKAKVVQSGYDNRHRPSPDTVRSWFRELEELGIGSTRGTGIRLEYSWNIPAPPLDELNPPPPPNVKKIVEKEITSPPTETTQNQPSIEKEDKLDNPTNLSDSGLPNLDVGLRDKEEPNTTTFDQYPLNPQSPTPNSEFEQYPLNPQPPTPNSQSEFEQYPLNPQPPTPNSQSEFEQYPLNPQPPTPNSQSEFEQYPLNPQPPTPNSQSEFEQYPLNPQPPTPNSQSEFEQYPLNPQPPTPNSEFEQYPLNPQPPTPNSQSEFEQYPLNPQPPTPNSQSEFEQYPLNPQPPTPNSQSEFEQYPLNPQPPTPNSQSEFEQYPLNPQPPTPNSQSEFEQYPLNPQPPTPNSQSEFEQYPLNPQPPTPNSQSEFEQYPLNPQPPTPKSQSEFEQYPLNPQPPTANSQSEFEQYPLNPQPPTAKSQSEFEQYPLNPQPPTPNSQSEFEQYPLNPQPPTPKSQSEFEQYPLNPQPPTANSQSEFEQYPLNPQPPTANSQSEFEQYPLNPQPPTANSQSEFEQYPLNPQPPTANSQSEFLIDIENSSTQSPAGDERLVSQPPDSLEITPSNYPLSGCDDGIAATEKVDTRSTFSPPVESETTFADGEEPDETVEVGLKVIISAVAPTQNLGKFEEYSQVVVTVEECTTDLELQDCTESNIVVTAEPSEHLLKSEVVSVSLRSPLSCCTNAELRTAILSPVLALVTAIGIQEHRSFLVKWFSNSLKIFPAGSPVS